MRERLKKKIKSLNYLAMRILLWLFRIIIFSFVLLFAFNNTNLVNLNLFLGVTNFTLQGPLIVWLLIAFIAGILLTLVFLFPIIVRYWRTSNRNAD
ncbi:MAG: hypothetical protein CBC01_02300 [Betaproteobacteria bacterium TMED41]|nr:MAG: hypothetical protein CBC01_02300 [Betaproteobacteria bacterium TMED41]